MKLSIKALTTGSTGVAVVIPVFPVSPVVNAFFHKSPPCPPWLNILQ